MTAVLLVLVLLTAAPLVVEMVVILGPVMFQGVVELLGRAVLGTAAVAFIQIIVIKLDFVAATFK